jgi:hypothetical protein
LKKIYLIILLTLPLFSDTLFNDFLAEGNGKSFVSLGFVHQDIISYESSQAVNLNYSFIHQDYWGIDVGYVQSIQDAKHTVTQQKNDFSSATLYGTYLLPFSNRIGLKSKIGYAKNRHAEDGFTYGAELIFQVSKNNGLSIAYHQMNDNMNYVMINTIYKLWN